MHDALRRIAGRISTMFGLSRQIADSDISNSTQTLQIYTTTQELRERVPLILQYGYACRPRPGSDVLVAFMGGDPSRPIAFATQDQRGWPRDLKPGEVCVYHPETGSRILLRSDGSIALLPANREVFLEGNLTATGIITGQTDVIAATISGKSHTHSGVQSGGSSTGKPQ